MGWVVLVHGGAGQWSTQDETQALSGVRAAVDRAVQVLARGASALDAAVSAVVALEDHPMFNAGTGCVLNRDGEAEMDASVMSGETLRCGGVAAIRRVRNPVRVAQAVMEKTPHVLLAGEGAQRFAREQGFEDYDPVTPRARERWRDRKAANAPPGTVGAVVLDTAGRLAAATSTGGVALKLPGRVGDSPIPGAGNYADAFAACSATGHGELMMRMLATKALCDRVAGGHSPQDAVDRQLAEMARAVGSECGFILVARDGRIGVGHGTASMPHAWRDEADQETQARMRVQRRSA